MNLSVSKTIFDNKSYLRGCVDGAAIGMELFGLCRACVFVPTIMKQHAGDENRDIFLKTARQGAFAAEEMMHEQIFIHLKALRMESAQALHLLTSGQQTTTDFRAESADCYRDGFRHVTGLMAQIALQLESIARDGTETKGAAVQKQCKQEVTLPRLQRPQELYDAVMDEAIRYTCLHAAQIFKAIRNPYRFASARMQIELWRQLVQAGEISQPFKASSTYRYISVRPVPVQAPAHIGVQGALALR